MSERKYKVHPLRVVLFLMIAVLVVFLIMFLVMQFRLKALNHLSDEAQQQIHAHKEYLNELESDASTPLDREDLENYLRDHNYRYPGDTYYQ